MIAFVSHPRFADHLTGQHHPERPERIRAIHAALRQAGMLDSPDPFPEFEMDFGLRRIGTPKLLELSAPTADLRWLRATHDEAYLTYVLRVCDAGGGVLDQGDTVVSSESYDIALMAAGAVLHACDIVMSGQATRAFAAVRPPGHHAEPNRALGFCLFNNVAIAARYLQQHYGAIVDFDVHHGNGTQAIFESDPSVHFFSLHQDPRTLWPRSGYAWEIGTGKARGYTMNIPFNPGSGDIDYLRVIDNVVLPELEEFAPEVLLISAGFDAHKDDPLADIELSEEGFELMTRSLCALADRHCRGRVVSTLEGGYNLRALGRSVVRHLAGMA
jgi:acetoin utilization deacetylase AcuC-like enzyme